ncbi:hypothetical protein SAMN05216357_10596 [Porphyromonadaceae bacterium KH3CP3RA]|nr:hypothetical protein SAMN05216357_10596 [Porphyromonadaceae bacterium KH3CP3RA]
MPTPSLPGWRMFLYLFILKRSNVTGILIAAGIFYPANGFLLNLMIAGAAMALSSVSLLAITYG